VAPEQQKDRALTFIAIGGIAALVVGSMAGGAYAWSQFNTSSPVSSAEVQAYSQRTPVTPEVAAEIAIQKQASAEWIAAREQERLDLERRTESRD
jgi:hypothetical protein